MLLKTEVDRDLANDNIAKSYAFTPALRRKVIIGHQFVKADWKRFNPTKAVNRNQY
jgi:hypothetical protein